MYGLSLHRAKAQFQVILVKENLISPGFSPFATEYIAPGSVERYFKALNVSISQDQFALSEMIQFIWRSAIRDGKPIDLFVPSARMRGLLMDWFNGNLGNLREPVAVEKYEET